jgi:hypothetical protein
MRVLNKELWPYRTQVKQSGSNSTINDIEYWLGITLGCFKGQWNVVYNVNSTDFYFREPDDLMMFKLTWS